MAVNDVMDEMLEGGRERAASEDGAEPRGATERRVQNPAPRISGAATGLSARQGETGLAAELGWLERVIEARLALHFGSECSVSDVRQLPPPVHAVGAEGVEARFGGLDFDERVMLALALAPALRPQALDLLLLENPNHARGFAEFGGRRGSVHGGFLPTLETAVFICAGEDLDRRVASLRLLDPEGRLVRSGLLQIGSPPQNEPPLTAPLLAQPQWLAQLLGGTDAVPELGSDFPAHRLETSLSWADLVLPGAVLEEIDYFRLWLTHGDHILRDWGLAASVARGYRCLFYGPPGTGKTLTATLLGQACERAVYRVDLSMVVSKYIGETEKNLANVFEQARWRDWILFFDEADALFGKRTQTSNAHDRYANQEVAFLLQRVEEFEGVVILASNLKQNLDEAFARRFQSIVYFPMPDAELRQQLWHRLLAPGGRLDADVDLEALAERHEIAGGSIRNAVQHAVLLAAGSGRETVAQADLERAVRRELRKEGRIG